MINRKCTIGKKALAARRIAAILMTGTLAGTMAAAVPGAIEVTAATTSSNADYIFEYLTKKLGYNEAAACGIMANIRCESSFNPLAWNAGGGSYGLCQWTGGRYGRLQSWCRSNGFDYTTIDGQLAYLEYELSTYYTSVENYLRSVENNSDGAYNAGQYYCYHFEAPASRGSVSHYRGGLAGGTFWETYRPAEWYQADGKWRYIKRDGTFQTSWLTIDNETCYLDQDGNRVSGWKTIDGKKYYFDKDGIMATGWVRLEGRNYYFDEDGGLITGLVRGGGDWYLLDQNGGIKSSAEMEDFAASWTRPSDKSDDVGLASAEEDASRSVSASSDGSGQIVSSGSSEKSASSVSLPSMDILKTAKDTPVTLAGGFPVLPGVSETIGGVSDDNTEESAAGRPEETKAETGEESVAAFPAADTTAENTETEAETDGTEEEKAVTADTTPDASDEETETPGTAEEKAAESETPGTAEEKSAESETAGKETEESETAEEESAEGSEAAGTGERALSGEKPAEQASENTSDNHAAEYPEEFAAAEALRAAAEAMNTDRDEDDSDGFFLLYEPQTLEDSGADVTQTADPEDEDTSSIRVTLEEDIPAVTRDEMQDLAEILHEKDLLHAVTEDGKDITGDLKVTYEAVRGKTNVYRVTFAVEYKGERAAVESEVTVSDS